MKKKRTGIGVLLAVFWLLAAACLPVYGAERPILELKQTTASGKSITVSMRLSGEAVEYRFYCSSAGKEEYRLCKSLTAGKGRRIVEIPVGAKNAGTYCDVKAEALDADGRQLSEEILRRCPTLPAKPDEPKQTSAYTARQMKLAWNRSETASGYRVETYNYQTKETRYFQAKVPNLTVPMEQDTLYRVRICGWMDLKTGTQTKRLYGAYRTIYTAQTPRVRAEGLDRHSVRVSWREVCGAESYAVFLSTKQTSGYRRVDVTKEPMSVLDGLTPGVRYYVLVRANKRAGGVLHRSPCTYVYPFRIDA